MRKVVFIMLIIFATIVFSSCANKKTESELATNQSSKTEKIPSTVQNTSSENTNSENTSSENTNSENTNSENTQMVNPIKNYSNLKAMQKNAPFILKVPTAKIDGYSVPTYYSVDENVFRIKYTKNDITDVLVSISQSVSDPSGDYTKYATTKAVEINGNTVTCKTNDGDAENAIFLATWTSKDSINYAINGATLPELEKLVKSIG